MYNAISPEDSPCGTLLIDNGSLGVNSSHGQRVLLRVLQKTSYENVIVPQIPLTTLQT